MERILAFSSKYMSLACVVSEISDILVKNRRFQPTPTLFGDPVGISRDLWHQKTRVFGLSYGVACMILCLAVLVQYRRVTDGQTDSRTHVRRQHTPR